MTDAGPADTNEFASHAEHELHEKLEIVRVAEPAAPHALLPRISRTLRWQRLLQAPLTVFATLAGGLLTAARAFTRTRRGGR